MAQRYIGAVHDICNRVWAGVHVHPHDSEVRVNVCRRYNLVLVLPSVYLNRKARTAPRTLAVRSKRAECRVQEFQPVSIQRTCGLSFNSCSNRSANVSTSGSGRPVHTREKLSSDEGSSSAWRIKFNVFIYRPRPRPLSLLSLLPPLP